MTTEDDFQAALDRNPTDAVTRLVFADFLEERGDPRAAGYRALGEAGKYPNHPGVFLQRKWSFTRTCETNGKEWETSRVPPQLTRVFDFRTWGHESRRGLEDRFALGWAVLTDEERRLALHDMTTARRGS